MTTRRLIAACSILMSAFLSAAGTRAEEAACVDTVDPDSNGCFLAHLDMRAVGDRDFVLLDAFEYRDPRGRLWVVPEGARVDGASIPRYLWVVGSPWVGGYRRASVIHDYFYRHLDHGTADVHRVFFEAMLAGGVNSVQARLMYQVVSTFTEHREPSGIRDGLISVHVTETGGR